MLNLRIGDKNTAGTVEILDEDRLCYYVLSTNRGASGIRTISKALLKEFITYEHSNPNSDAQTARNVLGGTTSIDKFEYGYCSTLWAMAKLNKAVGSRYGASGLFPNSKSPIFLPLQQIYYGAPGTGKSFEINRLTKGYAVVRTTFHPDSDYSTFVGCYKPQMEGVKQQKNLSISTQDLAQILNGYYNDSSLGNIGGIQKFVYEYYMYLNGEIMAVNINQLLTLAGISTSYAVEVNKYLKFCKMLPKKTEKKIVYKFVKQAFLKAYLGAWRKYAEGCMSTEGKAEPQFLVIEEINRGNCAQIFGDIFQLLDRQTENGFSCYPIEADSDLQLAIKEAFNEEEDYMIPNTLNVDGVIEDYTSNYGATLSEDIINGRVMLLPPNLYIWATMNTSDQSLFPIDSAFKRRWENVYVPIDTEKEEWYIDVDGAKYSWSLFLKKINDEIRDTTSSEDKQLGFYFCKAKDGIIPADLFVSKVLFYLYNDVFKDYGLERDFFKDKDDNNKIISFQSMFKGMKQVDFAVVAKLLKNLGVEAVEE